MEGGNWEGKGSNKIDASIKNTILSLSTYFPNFKNSN